MNEINQDIMQGTGGPAQPKKKKSGCSCCLIGCFAMVLIICLPIIGGFIYLSSLDEAVFGEKIVWFIKQPEVSEGIKSSILTSTELDETQKKVFINVYDQLISEYDKLSPEKQEIIHRNIIIVMRKAATNPEGLKKDPPAELQEIIQILGFPTFENINLNKLQLNGTQTLQMEQLKNIQQELKKQIEVELEKSGIKPEELMKDMEEQLKQMQDVSGTTE